MRGWREVWSAPGPALVLGVDFGIGRHEAGFTDLARGAVLPIPVWETVVPGGTADPDVWVRDWVAEVQETGRPVSSVLGYCAGTWLAGEVASALADHQSAPRLVVFDPELVHAETLARQLVTSVESLAEVLDDDVVARALESGHELAGSAGTLLDLAGSLTATYAGVATAACEELDADDETRDEFADRFRDYLTYLAVAGNAARTDLEPDLVVLSATHDSPLSGSRDRRLELPRELLLESPAVVSLLREVGALDAGTG